MKPTLLFLFLGFAAVAGCVLDAILARGDLVKLHADALRKLLAARSALAIASMAGTTTKR